jgi:hypothetical protein
MPASSEGAYVLLRGGFAVPVEPVVLLFELEDRGFTFARSGDDGLIVRPFSQLTEQDRAQIRRWKQHLLALLAYEPPAIE